MKKYRGFLSQLEREINQLNNHMPRTKKSLSQLLNEKAPSFTTRDGESSAVKLKELKALAEEIPTKFHDKILLPFTILRRTSLGPGAHTIGGSKLEQFALLRIAQKINTPFTAWRESQLPRCIYSPEVALIRQKLPTTVMIGFGT